MKQKYRVMEGVDVTESLGSSEHGLRVTETMNKVRNATYSVRLLHDVDFQEHVDLHKFTCGECGLFMGLCICCSTTCHVVFEVGTKRSIPTAMS